MLLRPLTYITTAFPGSYLKGLAQKPEQLSGYPFRPKSGPKFRLDQHFV